MSKQTQPAAPKKRDCVFDKDFREDLEYWVKTKPSVTGRLLGIVESVIRDPFTGIGKPEALSHLGPNVWSRRLTEEHRVVYVVRDDRIVFVQGRMHY
jgi:toxin YoeB